MYSCLGVTCQLHSWQNDRGLLRATVVTRGWNGHRKRVSTQSWLWRKKKKISLRSFRDSNSQPFDRESGVLSRPPIQAPPTSYPGSQYTLQALTHIDQSNLGQINFDLSIHFLLIEEISGGALHVSAWLAWNRSLCKVCLHTLRFQYVTFNFTLNLSLNGGGRWGTTDDFTVVSSIFPVLHCPLGFARLQACPFLNIVFLLLFVWIVFFPVLLCPS